MLIYICFWFRFVDFNGVSNFIGYFSRKARILSYPEQGTKRVPTVPIAYNPKMNETARLVFELGLLWNYLFLYYWYSVGFDLWSVQHSQWLYIYIYIYIIFVLLILCIKKKGLDLWSVQQSRFESWSCWSWNVLIYIYIYIYIVKKNTPYTIYIYIYIYNFKKNTTWSTWSSFKSWLLHTSQIKTFFLYIVSIVQKLYIYSHRDCCTLHR